MSVKDGAAGATAAKLTGDHKRVLASFVVLKLVELRSVHTTDDSTSEETYDESAERDVAVEWARAYAERNLATVISGAADKAAKSIAKEAYFLKLADRAAVHVAAEDSTDLMRADFETTFTAVYKKALVTVTAPKPRAKRKTAGTARLGTLDERAKAVVGELIVPIPPAALATVLDTLCSERMRQLLPALPPAAGTPAKTAWSDALKLSGPLAQGHWLLDDFRSRAGKPCDSDACSELAGSLSDILESAFKGRRFHSIDGRHIMCGLRTAVDQAACSQRALEAWESYVGKVRTAADAPSGSAAPCIVAALDAASKRNLFMVFAELANCWGQVMLGRWPLPSAAESGSLEAESSTDDVPVSAAGGSAASASEYAPPPPIAIVNMAGAALARMSRKLSRRLRKPIVDSDDDADEGD
jgi:hypothetical protein